MVNSANDRVRTAHPTRLSRLTGIPQATISAIENDRVRLCVERVKVLAKTLKCHAGVLKFPGGNCLTKMRRDQPMC